MTDIRLPVVAGTFYPATAGVLAATIDDLLETATAPTRRTTIDRSSVCGVVVPHAGYEFSAPIAASAYALLRSLEQPPTVVVILGPSHFEPLHGLAVPAHAAWRTPLGDVPVDDATRRALVLEGATLRGEPHAREHSIEVQLPFLQRCLPGRSIVPVAVGGGSPQKGAEILQHALPADALLVVSTDLSHYHDAATARRLDARTATTIEALDVGSLDPTDACGVDAVRVAMAWARLRDARIEQLDLRTSADTAGNPERVVGYGAFVISDGSPRRP